jgi:hypothetical protein
VPKPIFTAWCKNRWRPQKCYRHHEKTLSHASLRPSLLSTTQALRQHSARHCLKPQLNFLFSVLKNKNRPKAAFILKRSVA